MANVSYGKYVFSLDDLKVTNLAGSTQEDLDAGMELTLTPEFLTGKLQGDTATKAIVTILMGAQATVSGGSISSAALAIITGKSLTTAGTTPIPRSGIMKARSAMEGMVCRTPTPRMTPSAALRVRSRRSPRGTATRMPIPMDQPTSRRWRRAREASSALRLQR